MPIVNDANARPRRYVMAWVPQCVNDFLAAPPLVLERFASTAQRTNYYVHVGLRSMRTQEGEIRYVRASRSDLTVGRSRACGVSLSVKDKRVLMSAAPYYWSASRRLPEGVSEALCRGLLAELMGESVLYPPTGAFEWTSDKTNALTNWRSWYPGIEIAPDLFGYVNEYKCTVPRALDDTVRSEFGVSTSMLMNLAMHPLTGWVAPGHRAQRTYWETAPPPGMQRVRDPVEVTWLRRAPSSSLGDMASNVTLPALRSWVWDQIRRCREHRELVQHALTEGGCSAT